MKEYIKKNKKIITFALYMVITFALIFFHENWRDEAQAWLIAKDCNVFELLHQMKYEGHFLLWYLILMPFAKLGLPYFTTNVISWIITSLSVWLILDKAPFKFYKRVLLIFTFPLLYLFPIISRCYCLIPLEIVLMCIFYKDRKERPLRYLLSVVLLANTHVIMLGMVGIVLLEYIIEFYKDSKNISAKDKKKQINSLAITIILLILTMLPLFGCLSTNQDIGTTNNFVAKVLTTVFYCPKMLIMKIFNFFMYDIIMSSLILIITMVLMLFEIKNYPLTYLKIFLCVMWQCLIYSFIYSSSFQRASTVIFILLYFKWTNAFKENKQIKDIEKRIVNLLWMILVIINILGGILYIIFYEIPYNCSNAYQMGNYINENLSDGSIILNGPRVEFASSIIPYMKKDIKFYHITGNRYFSYAIWDNQNKLEIELEDIKELSNIFDEEQKLYYIYCIDKFDVGEEKIEYNEMKVIEECIEKGIFKELYSTEKESLYLESYVIYEVNL